MRNKLIIAEVVFIVIVAVAVFVVYPRANFDIKGNEVTFSPIGANAIIISDNEGFIGARILEIEEDTSVEFEPGTYYWKPENDYFEGFKRSFTIDSSVGLEIEREEEKTEVINVGDVKIDIRKNEEGKYVGRFILEPDESAEVEDEGVYTGREADE